MFPLRADALFILVLAELTLPFCLVRAASDDTVTITSEPSGARVEANGKFIGTTPFEWRIGNWAFNPHKHTVFSKHLQDPVLITVIKEGFVPKTVTLTGPSRQWNSLNGANHYTYYLIQSSEYRLKLDKVGDFLGGNPFNVLGPTSQPGSGPEASLEVMINLSMPSVVTLTTQVGSGSGFFVSRNGVIVTNKHVVGPSNRVRVLNASGKLFETESIYTDPDHDLALVKIECSDCPALTLAEPSSINVGQEVVAIGSPGLAGMSFRNSVTRGIVSAFRGPNDSGHVYIQTDAQINPGNSGGPLLNKWGYVVGVNTLKVVSEGYSGLGFAISSNDVLQMLDRRFKLLAPRGSPPQNLTTELPRESAVGSKLTGRPLSNEDVVKLRDAGLSDDLLVAKIKSSPAAFHLEPEDLIALKKASVSEAVIEAMLETQSRK